jgi:SulP family sulfate permease
MRGNVLKIRGNLYYGSLPVVESTFHGAVARERALIIDFSDCYYIDQEGIRWLASAKARHKVVFTDRRSGEDRRDGQDRRAASGDRKRATGRRRSRADRRQRSEF